jgi:hypothetical protein
MCGLGSGNMGATLQHKCCPPRAPNVFASPIPALATDLPLSWGKLWLPRLWKNLTRNVHRRQSVISKRPSHCRALVVLALVVFSGCPPEPAHAYMRLVFRLGDEVCACSTVLRSHRCGTFSGTLSGIRRKTQEPIVSNRERLSSGQSGPGSARSISLRRGNSMVGKTVRHDQIDRIAPTARFQLIHDQIDRIAPTARFQLIYLGYDRGALDTSPWAQQNE